MTMTRVTAGQPLGEKLSDSCETKMVIICMLLHSKVFFCHGQKFLAGKKPRKREETQEVEDTVSPNSIAITQTKYFCQFILENPTYYSHIFSLLVNIGETH